MKNKIIITSILASTFILSGCSSEKADPNTENTQQPILASENIPQNIFNNPLYLNYKSLYQQIADNTLNTPQEVVDFFSKDNISNTSVSFQDKRDDNGNISELIFTCNNASLTLEYEDDKICWINFNSDNNSIQNTINTDENLKYSISRHFDNGEIQANNIDKFNATEGEKLYKKLLLEVIKTDDLKLEEIEAILDYKFKDSDKEITEKTLTEDNSITYNYNINSEEYISLLTSNGHLLSITYVLTPNKSNSEANYINHTYYTERFRERYINSSEGTTTPKALTNRQFKDIQPQMEACNILFE